jgi:hypothetical protein
MRRGLQPAEEQSTFSDSDSHVLKHVTHGVPDNESCAAGFSPRRNSPPEKHESVPVDHQ